MRRADDPLRAYLSTFVVLGVALSLLGPSLTALRGQVGVGVGTIGLLFTAQSMGYVGGAILGGRWLDRGHGHRLVSAALVLVAAGALALSLPDQLSLLALVAAAIGFGCGVIEVGCNAMLAWSRPGEVGPAMNLLHFCFGVGALATPLLVDRSLAWTDGLVLACSVLAGAALGAIVLLTRHAVPSHAPVVDGEGTTPAFVLAAVGGFFFLYVGAEVGFAGWLHTYGEETGLGSSGASLLLAAFWASFTLARVGAAALARTVAPERLVGGGMAVSLVGILGVAVGDGAAVWLGTVVLAAGLAPQFPGVLAFVDTRVRLTGSATSWFVAASGISGMVLPWVLGVLLDRLGASSLPIAVGALVVATTAWFAGLVVMFDRRTTAVATAR